MVKIMSRDRRRPTEDRRPAAERGADEAVKSRAKSGSAPLLQFLGAARTVTGSRLAQVRLD